MLFLLLACISVVVKIQFSACEGFLLTIQRKSAWAQKFHPSHGDRLVMGTGTWVLFVVIAHIFICDVFHTLAYCPIFLVNQNVHVVRHDAICIDVAGADFCLSRGDRCLSHSSRHT